MAEQQPRNHVLLVDDEDGILLLLTRILEPAGYTVQTASDAHAALRHIAEGPPAVALCDIHMPGPSGLWLAEQIRHASPATAVVLATSDANVPPAESLREGVVAYVLKPFEPAEVLQAVAEAYTWWSARSGQPVPTLQPRRRRTTAAAAAVPTAWPAPPARTGRTGRRVVSPRTWLIVLIGVILAAAAAWYWWRGNPDRQLSRIAAASGMVLVFDGQGGKVAQGSGFFVSPDLFATNHHVVNGGLMARIETGATTYNVAGLAAMSRAHDLVLLQTVRGSPDFLDLAKEVPGLGSRIAIFGAPSGFKGTLSTGIINAAPGQSDALLQFSAPIGSGSSGSPLLNDKGQVVGVVTSVARSVQGVGFAARANWVQDLLSHISPTQPLLMAARGTGDDRERHELVGPVRLVTAPRDDGSATPTRRIFSRAGRLLGEDAGGVVIDYEYWEDGQIKAERHTQGATLVADVRFIPDGQTAMVSVPDSSGTVRRLEYLADGRLAAEQTLVRGRMVASSRWVYEGAWPRVSNGSTAQAREELDALGNPLVRILTDGTRLQYTHVVDAHGNWVSRKIIRVDPQGGQSPAVSQSRHIEYWD